MDPYSSSDQPSSFDQPSPLDQLGLFDQPLSASGYRPPNLAHHQLRLTELVQHLSGSSFELAHRAVALASEPLAAKHVRPNGRVERDPLGVVAAALVFVRSHRDRAELRTAPERKAAPILL